MPGSFEEWAPRRAPVTWSGGPPSPVPAVAQAGTVGAPVRIAASSLTVPAASAPVSRTSFVPERVPLDAPAIERRFIKDRCASPDGPAGSLLRRLGLMEDTWNQKLAAVIDVTNSLSAKCERRLSRLEDTSFQQQEVVDDFARDIALQRAQFAEMWRGGEARSAVEGAGPSERGAVTEGIVTALAALHAEVEATKAHHVAELELLAQAQQGMAESVSQLRVDLERASTSTVEMRTELGNKVADIGRRVDGAVDRLSSLAAPVVAAAPFGSISPEDMDQLETSGAESSGLVARLRRDVDGLMASLEVSKADFYAAMRADLEQLGLRIKTLAEGAEPAVVADFKAWTEKELSHLNLRVDEIGELVNSLAQAMPAGNALDVELVNVVRLADRRTTELEQQLCSDEKQLATLRRRVDELAELQSDFCHGLTDIQPQDDPFRVWDEQNLVMV